MTQGELDFEKAIAAFKPLGDLLDTYFNTTNLTGRDLRRRELRAGTQNAIILSFFRRHPNEVFTPFDVQPKCLPMTPITSIRRSITSLTSMGYLLKTDIRKPGIYGELNYTWTIKPN